MPAFANTFPLGAINIFQMSQRNGYLVPDRIFKVGEFRIAVMSILAGTGIINGSYDSLGLRLASGSNSSDIFTFPDKKRLAFEYAELRDSENLRLIPEGVGEGLEARCPQCNSNVDESLSDAVSEFYEHEYDT